MCVNLKEPLPTQLCHSLELDKGLPLDVEQVDDEALEQLQVLHLVAVADEVEGAGLVGAAVLGDRVHGVERVGAARDVRVLLHQLPLLLQNELEHLQQRGAQQVKR